MGGAERRCRLALLGVTAFVVLAAVAAPAQAQPPSEADMDPAQVVDVEDFEDRAQQYAEARRRAREAALRRAEELADQARTTTTTTTTTTEPPTTEPPTTEPPTTSTEAVKHPIPAGTTEEQWHALRQCESTQNYQAISKSGRYRGAYQFYQRTWDWVAEMHYPDLVGVDPIDASPSDQDKMAYKLYEINGWDPWPTCKKRLPS